MESHYPENVHDYDWHPSSPFYVMTDWDIATVQEEEKRLREREAQDREDELIACLDEE